MIISECDKFQQFQTYIDENLNVNNLEYVKVFSVSRRGSKYLKYGYYSTLLIETVRLQYYKRFYTTDENFDEEKVSLLLQHGADPNIKMQRFDKHLNKYINCGNRVFIQALEDNNMKLVNLILQYYPISNLLVPKKYKKQLGFYGTKYISIGRMVEIFSNFEERERIGKYSSWGDINNDAIERVAGIIFNQYLKNK